MGERNVGREYPSIYYLLHTLYIAPSVIEITACPDALSTYLAVPISEPLSLPFPLPGTLFLYIPTRIFPHFIQVSAQISSQRTLLTIGSKIAPPSLSISFICLFFCTACITIQHGMYLLACLHN